MKTHHIAIGMILLAGIGGGAFYGGMQYEKGVATKSGSFAGARNFSGGGNRQGGGLAGGQQASQNEGATRRGGPNGGGFVSGEILSKDDKSFTVKTRDGGSTIVYFTDALVVRKTEADSLVNLITGEQVLVSGKSNSDGSIAADTVSITPQVAK